jgi:hypothetical protein
MPPTYGPARGKDEEIAGLKKGTTSRPPSGHFAAETGYLLTRDIITACATCCVWGTCALVIPSWHIGGDTQKCTPSG